MVYRGLLVCCVLALGGCTRDVAIAVAQAGGKVVFTVTRNGEPACIDRIALYEGPAETREPLWSIMAGPEPRCESRFTLGESPPGFSASDRIAPQRLRPGKAFTVSVGGPGYMGGTSFTLK